jgi:hypothetical protein
VSVFFVLVTGLELRECGVPRERVRKRPLPVAEEGN